MSVNLAHSLGIAVPPLPGCWGAWCWPGNAGEWMSHAPCAPWGTGGWPGPASVLLGRGTSQKSLVGGDVGTRLLPPWDPLEGVLCCRWSCIGAVIECSDRVRPQVQLEERVRFWKTPPHFAKRRVRQGAHASEVQEKVEFVTLPEAWALRAHSQQSGAIRLRSSARWRVAQPRSPCLM